MRSPEQFRHREEPRFTESRVEDISHEILENQEIMDYLTAKIQQKLDFKESVSRDDGTNDFSPWKRLGMFIVHEDRLPNELVSILHRNGVDIYGDEVLELHIPPQSASIADVKASLERLRQYLRARSEEGRVPRYIFGVSYLARLAEHWGFTVVDLPEDIQKSSGAAKVLPSFSKRYTDATDEKKKRIAEKYTTRNIKLCFISVDDLLSDKKVD
jgi:hypothetical protein